MELTVYAQGAEHCPGALLRVEPLDGHVMLGASASRTVTLIVHDTVLPAASAAEKPTVEDPTLNRLPLTAPIGWLTVAAQLSLAVALLNDATALHK